MMRAAAWELTLARGDLGTVRLEHDGAVAVLVIARPDRRNALTPGMLDAMRGFVGEVARCEARALVLAGDGPVFCGGFDLKMCLDMPGTLEVLLRGLAGLVQELQALPKPVVVAAHGAAIAGGCALLAAADVVVTDKTAKIGYPVTPLGVSPAVSAASLRLAVGDGPCRERQLDPGLISGTEAVRIGLAHEVIDEPGQVRARAMERARGLAEKPARVFAATKGWVNEIAAAMGVSGASERALRASLSVAGSAEERERLARVLARP
jgi:enoyl-CoA hydratase/carnithine racemase